MSCRLLWRGNYGVEAQIFHDGELLIGQRFAAAPEAQTWAAAERQEAEVCSKLYEESFDAVWKKLEGRAIPIDVSRFFFRH